MKRMDLAAIKTLGSNAEVKQAKSSELEIAKKEPKTAEIVEKTEVKTETAEIKENVVVEIEEKKEISPAIRDEMKAEIKRLDKSLLFDKNEEEPKKKFVKNKRKEPYQTFSMALKYQEYQDFFDYLDIEEVNPSQFLRIVLREKGII